MTLREHKNDMRFVNLYYGKFINADLEIERKLLTEYRTKLETLIKAQQTKGLQDKVDKAQKDFDTQNSFVNDVIQYQKKWKTMQENLNQLEFYVKNI